MIIIADSGSTKTDWCVVNHGKQVKRITTEAVSYTHLTLPTNSRV